ncbi:MAG: class I SAM-dependent methyltransferase [Actinomycetota bacterium]
MSPNDAVAGIHPAAAVGFQQAAEEYRRGRPGYPEEAVRFLAEVLGLGPGRRVLELGAGTGKLTRLLVPTGARVIAVEPVPAMRAALVADVPGAAAIGGRAEAIPLADGSADAAVAAAAFHWFDGPAALRELHRVLRDDSVLAVAWNARDEERSELWRRVTEVMALYRGDAPSYRSMEWRRAFDATDLFTPLQTLSFPYEHETTRDGALDRVSSVSFIAALPEPGRVTVREQVLRLLDEDLDIGPSAERFSLPYRTDVHWCRRR